MLGGATLRASNFKFESYFNTASIIPHVGMMHFTSLTNQSGVVRTAWVNQISNFIISASRDGEAGAYSCIYQESGDANHYSNFYIGHAQYANVYLKDVTDVNNVATGFSNGYMDSGNASGPYVSYHFATDSANTAKFKGIRLTDIFFNNPAISALFLQSSLGTLQVSNCYFNVCPTAVIAAGDSTRSAVLSLDGCTFSGCSKNAGDCLIRVNNYDTIKIINPLIRDSVLSGAYFFAYFGNNTKNVYTDDVHSIAGTKFKSEDGAGSINFFGTHDGTWLPVDLSAGSLTFASSTGEYKLDGVTVHFCLEVVYPTTTDAEQARISLPFNSKNGTLEFPAATGLDGLYASVVPNSNYLVFRNSSTGFTAVNATLSGKKVRIAGTYTRQYVV